MAAVQQKAPSIARGAAGGSMSAAAPKRSGNGMLTVVTLGATLVVGFTLGFIPWVGGAVSHAIDRVSNHIKANRELDARADWYRDQIATMLRMDPAKVKGKHLEKAAAINPVLAAAVKDVHREQAKENKTSMVVNGAASMIPGGTAIKEVAGAAVAVTKGAKVASSLIHTGKILAATTAGGLLVDWTTKAHLSAQEVIEGISNQREAAIAQGMNLREAVTPQMIFTLRIAQDEKLGAEIEANYKKPFHKMSVDEQTQVMQNYTPLANAATSEAYAVANNMLPVQELMARAPNLNGTAQYMIGQKAGTFAGRLADGRTDQVAMVRGRAANDGGFAATEEARRHAAAARALEARKA